MRLANPVKLKKKYSERGSLILEMGSVGRGWGLNLALGKNDDLIVLQETLHRVIVYSKDATLCFSFGKYGKGPGEFYSPVGLCLDQDSRIIVSDSGNNRIQIFTADGTFISMFGSNKMFSSLSGIATSPEGNLVVSDGGKNLISVFSIQGKLLHSFGKRGKSDGCFNSPAGVAVDNRGNIIVADQGNARIQIFSSTGIFQRKITGNHNIEQQLHEPCCVVVDRDGNIGVSDAMRRCVSLWSQDGEHIANVAFCQPAWTGLAIDSFGHLALLVGAHLLRYG